MTRARTRPKGRRRAILRRARRIGHAAPRGRAGRRRRRPPRLRSKGADQQVRRCALRVRDLRGRMRKHAVALAPHALAHRGVLLASEAKTRAEIDACLRPLRTGRQGGLPRTGWPPAPPISTGLQEEPLRGAPARERLPRKGRQDDRGRLQRPRSRRAWPQLSARRRRRPGAHLRGGQAVLRCRRPHRGSPNLRRNRRRVRAPTSKGLRGLAFAAPLPTACRPRASRRARPEARRRPSGGAG